MTRSSSVVRVRIKSGLSAIKFAVTEAFMLFSMTDMRSADKDDDNPSLPDRASFDILNKFVVSEFSSHADTTGSSIVVSETGTDVTVVAALSGNIKIGVEPTTASLLKTTALLLACETSSLSEPSTDSQFFELTELQLL